MTHTHSRLSDNAMGRPAPRPRFTSICGGCDMIATTPLPALPYGWKAENVGGTRYAFCPDCQNGGTKGGGK